MPTTSAPNSGPGLLARTWTADVPFLTGETGIPAERFSALITSAKLGSAGTDAGPTGVAVPAEVFYGLIRVGSPTDWAGLVALSVDQIAKVKAALQNPPIDVMLHDPGPALVAIDQGLVEALGASHRLYRFDHKHPLAPALL